MMAIEPQSHLTQQITSAIPLLIGTGVVTSLPLLFYGYGVRHAPLSVIGFFQFFGPTIQLLIALYVFHEPVHQHTLVPFCIIWAGVALFIFDSLRRKV
jgi:chloramphenicol-sensitive protein RarD